VSTAVVGGRGSVASCGLLWVTAHAQWSRYPTLLLPSKYIPSLIPVHGYEGNGRQKLGITSMPLSGELEPCKNNLCMGAWVTRLSIQLLILAQFHDLRSGPGIKPHVRLQAQRGIHLGFSLSPSASAPPLALSHPVSL